MRSARPRTTTSTVSRISKQLVHGLKEATEWKKPVFVKIAAVHNSAAIAAGIARSGADAVVIDGFRGGTGAAPRVFRDHVGIPIEAAVAAVDAKLRKQGIRNEVSIIASGGIRQSADVAKIICLGADAVYIGTSALVAMGCRVCGTCNRGVCAWGIATQRPELTKRLDPETNAVQVANLIHGWTDEIAELMGAAGINSIESLRGNRDRLRGYMLDEGLLKVLDVKTSGGVNDGHAVHIDAKNLHYTPLNQQIRAAIAGGAKEIVIDNVLGQRFIGDGLRGDDVTITVNGVPGGDLAMFMSGPTIIVHGNADHAPGNTMDQGKVIIHGSAGDAVAHSMRGGRVYVRDNIGYRGGIHMKQYKEKRPIVVVGGFARAFLGEYMAGGLLIVLGLGGTAAGSRTGYRQRHPWRRDLHPRNCR